MYNILVAEDEQAVNDLITMNLKLAGYGFDKAYNGKEAFEKAKMGEFHLILLDVMLPIIDGFELAEMLGPYNIPIIFITAKNSLASKIRGFDLGARDYVVKPFEMLELQARIRVVLNSRYGETESIMAGGVKIDIKQRRVFVGENEVSLTKYEFDLLEMLAINKNIALSREKLLETVWGYNSECDSRTVDVYIQKLRKKLGFEDTIKTVYRVGYRLEV